jgi:hypothetical protein
VGTTSERAAGSGRSDVAIPSKPFERFAGGCAIAVGLGTILYSVAFVIALRTTFPPAVTATALLLLLGGFLTTPVSVALYLRLRPVEEGFALWALLLALLGAAGATIHGGFDLARLVGPPTLPTEIPNPVDPRGLLTFGVAGAAVFVFASLIRRGGGLPRGLGVLGMVAGGLLILIYLGRLIIFDPANPALLTAAVLGGLVVNPAWYLWLGIALRRA